MSTQDPSSNMDDAWVARALAQCPTFAFPPDHPSAGSIRTCPVRLSFVYLFTPQKAMEQGRPDKYVATCLFPVAADHPTMLPLREAASACAFAKWPNLGQPGGVQPAQLHTPFKDQAEKAQWEGYVPGHACFTASSERRAPVVDIRGAPLVEPTKVYPGVWALVTVRPFAFETRHPQTQAVLKRGVSFGLQSVLILADDKELGGGGGNPAEEFAGINVEGLTSGFDPLTAFGAGQRGAAAFDPLAAAAAAAQAVQPRSVF